MKTVLVLAGFFLVSSMASAASDPFLNGDYQCEDGGTLSLQWSPASNSYDASLDYADGRSSVLNQIIVVQNGKAIILSDEGDKLGVATSNDAAGTRLTLKLNYGTKLFCRHATMASIVEE